MVEMMEAWFHADKDALEGFYGQNFRNIPELRWAWGYGWSWGLIVVTTLIQLWFFRRRRWI